MPRSLQTATRGQEGGPNLQVKARNRRTHADIDKYLDFTLVRIRCAKQTKGVIRPVKILFREVDGIQSFNFGEAAYLVGKPLVDLVRRNRGNVYGEDYIYKMGYTESVYDTTDYEKPPQDQWLIEKIWLSSGENGEIKDQYYTLEHQTKVCSRILLYTLQIDYADPDEAPIRRTNSTIQDTADTIDDSTFIYEGRGRYDAICAIHTFCAMHPGRRLCMLNPEGRQQFSTIRKFHFERERVLFRNESYLCVEASLCNALSLVFGYKFGAEVWNYLAQRIRRNRRIAREFMTFLEPLAFQEMSKIADRTEEVKSTMKRKFMDFRDAQKFIQEQVGTVALVKMKGDDGKPLSKFDLGSLESSEDVLLVSVESLDGTKHAVCVDGRRKVIIDPVEFVLMKLCDEALRRCVGKGRVFKRIEDVRMVRELRGRKDGKGTRRGRKRSRRLAE